MDQNAVRGFSYIFLKSQGIKEHTELSWEGVDTMGFGKTETGAMVGAGGWGGNHTEHCLLISEQSFLNLWL